MEVPFTAVVCHKIPMLDVLKTNNILCHTVSVHFCVLESTQQEQRPGECLCGHIFVTFVTMPLSILEAN